MNKEKIESIRKDIATYRQAVNDMKDALAVAERELDEALSSEYEKFDPLPEPDAVVKKRTVTHAIEIQLTIDGMQLAPMRYSLLESTADDKFPF